MSAARLCCNGDGRTIQPPSNVLCRECMDGIGKKMRAMLEEMRAEDADKPRGGAKDGGERWNDTHSRRS